ncbi:hypothetical protein [Terracoccus luteus]|jgi:hypothetical protein|uniref:Uncharacterized protein n=1 Tax=Terracoccus luteus TaxID=53356 RepID=A0A839PU28_9MICO|nr:hypothetical protein [Terracoccus luteus]MBB2986543.1 hypothetical protein [Terracoccus luteus]MCP2171868.1 hypothetical protein [Terracoccus luteus]
MTTPDPATSPDNAVKTYRYLRLAMPTLVVMLFAAIAIEWGATGRRCLQESISAYYYTPAQGVFVGVLVAIGVCLVSIKGSTDLEDVLLNTAGIFAPIVAFVPTPKPGSCRSVPEPLLDTAAGVSNNVGALLVMGTVALVVAALVFRREAANGQARRALGAGILVTAATIAVGAVAFFAARGPFLEYAHYVAAFAMFGPIVGVVVINARLFGEARVGPGASSMEVYRNRYTVIAVLMVAALVLMYGWSLLVGWVHAVLWIEGVLITLFAVFWSVQTAELWNTLSRGARTRR